MIWVLLLGATKPRSVGGGWWCDCKCFAMSARTEPFFAFDANAVKALDVLVVGLKMSVYAAISAAVGGGSLCAGAQPYCITMSHYTLLL